MKRHYLTTFITCIVILAVAFGFNSASRERSVSGTLKVGFLYENDESTETGSSAAQSGYSMGMGMTSSSGYFSSFAASSAIRSSLSKRLAAAPRWAA